MKQNLKIAILMTIVTTVLLGLIYPLVVTGLAQLLFRDKANGQLISRNGEIVGSRIIGQAFRRAGIPALAAIGGGTMAMTPPIPADRTWVQPTST